MARKVAALYAAIDGAEKFKKFCQTTYLKIIGTRYRTVGRKKFTVRVHGMHSRGSNQSIFRMAPSAAEAASLE